MQKANMLKSKEMVYRHDIEALKSIISTATKFVPDQDYHNTYKERLSRAFGLADKIISLLGIEANEIKLMDLKLRPGSEDPPLRKEYVLKDSQAKFIGIAPQILGNYDRLKASLSQEDLEAIRHAIGAFINVGAINDDQLAMSRYHTQEVVDLAVQFFEEHASKAKGREDTVVVDGVLAAFWKPELVEIFDRNPEFQAIGNKLYFEIDFNGALGSDININDLYGPRLEALIKALDLWPINVDPSHKFEIR